MKKSFRYFFPLLIVCSILFSCAEPATPVMITLEQNNIEIEEGKDATLKATVLPEGTVTEITWSSDKEAVATVDQTGKVTAVAPGVATITATTTEGATAKCEVTVKAKPVVTISLDQSKVELEEGKEVTLNATVSPEGTENTVTWSSSNEGFATVDQTGKVTAVAPGVATITAKITDEIKATCEVTVTAKPEVITISLDQSKLEIEEGKNATLKATVLPEGTENTVTWSSSNEGFATVDQNGKVTAVAPGVATITAKITDEIKATCEVTVTAKPVVTISLDQSKVELEEGKEVTLNATVSPEGTENTVTWSSSNEGFATVDQNGKVTAVAPGVATITAKITDEIKATCEVTVTAKPVVITISLDQAKLEIEEGKNATLLATVSPEGTENTVTWSSSNEGFATVDQNGKVTAVAPGVATITAKITDEIKATCEVTVYREDVTLELKNEDTLQGKLGSSIQHVKKLTLSGELKGDDWTTLRSLENLTLIDLSGCSNAEIPQNAFDGMKSKNFKIVLPVGITAIGRGAFRDCSISEIEIPPSMVFDKPSDTGVIRRWSFERAHIGHLIINSDKVYIDYGPFGSAIIDKVTFKEGVTATPEDLFNGHKYGKVTVKEIVFPESLTTITANTFINADIPANLTLPSTITKIDTGAFTGTGLSYYDVKPAEGAVVALGAFDHKYQIELSEQNIELEVGETKKLNALITLNNIDDNRPDGEPKLTWFSNSDYIQVDQNGNITATSPGNGTILAKTGEGSMAKCAVTAIEKPVTIDRAKYGFKDIPAIEHNGSMDKGPAEKAMTDISGFTNAASYPVLKMETRMLNNNGLLTIIMQEKQNAADKGKMSQTLEYNDMKLLIEPAEDGVTYTLNGVVVDETNEDVNILLEMSQDDRKLFQCTGIRELADGSSLSCMIENDGVSTYSQVRYKINSSATEEVVYEMKRTGEKYEVYIDGKTVNVESIDDTVFNTFKDVVLLVP